MYYFLISNKSTILSSNIVQIIFILGFIFNSGIFAQSHVYRDVALEKIQKKVDNGRCNSSFSNLKEIIKNEPDHFRAYLLLGDCSLEFEDYPSALKYYQKADSISEGILPKIGMQATYLQNGETQKSIQLGESLLNKDPFNSKIRMYLMFGYAKMNQIPKVEKEFATIESLFGRSAQLYWQRGLIDYNRNRMEDSEEYFREAYNIDPNYSPNRKSLGLSKNPFFVSITPVYANYNFSENSIKSSGSRQGAYTNVQFSDQFNLGLGSFTDQVTNLSASKGNLQYLKSEINLLWYSEYLKYIPNYSQMLTTYYNLPINQYYVLNNLAGSDFHLQQTSGHFEYRPDLDQKIRITHHVVASNDSFTHQAKITEFSYNFKQYSNFGIALARISYPKNNGSQGSLSWKENWKKTIFWESEAIFQNMAIQSSEIVYLSINPFKGYTSYSYKRSKFGAFQQTISIYFHPFSIGIGGRVGDLYTPILGGSPTLNPSVLKAGGFGFISFYPFSQIEMTLSASRDNWENPYHEKLYSNQTKFALTWRFE
jgi:tetratricopeptide (TPR) repeat protein